jgi:uncharacterized protein
MIRGNTSFYDSRIFRWIEMTLLFIGIPLLYYYDKIPFHKAIPLLAVFFVLFYFILKDNSFNRKIFWMNSFTNWKPILLRFIIIAVITVILVRIFAPDYWFVLPRERTVLWIMIMLLYPLWSAYPQELIYRTWFFKRYRDLLNDERLFFILNAALFSFSHIIFRNWLAIVLTFFGGLMFALTYRKSNSLMVVFVEHMLYGNFIFTVGIGQYFYLPMGGE